MVRLPDGDGDGNDQEHPAMIPDGSGNAIIVWSDQQIHAQKVDPDLAFQWGPQGVVVTSADGWQQVPVICGDGAGGVIVAWEDCRNGIDNRDIFVQRVAGSGAPAWARPPRAPACPSSWRRASASTPG